MQRDYGSIDWDPNDGTECMIISSNRLWNKWKEVDCEQPSFTDNVHSALCLNPNYLDHPS